MTDSIIQVALKESGGDEEFAQYPENHRFQVPPDAHWGQVRHTATNVGRALQAGMRTIETANPDKLFGIFGDAQWTNKDRLSFVLSPRQRIVTARENPRHQQRAVPEHPNLVAVRHEPNLAGRNLIFAVKAPQGRWQRVKRERH